MFGENNDIGAPLASRFDVVKPGPQLFRQSGDVKEVMVRDLEPRRLTGNLGNGVDEILGIQLVPARIALISSRAFAAANGTRALDIAVGQGVAADRIDSDILLLDDHVPVVATHFEHTLNHPFMVDGGRSSEQVVRQTQGHEIFDDDPVILISQLLGRFALRLGGHEDGRTVLIRARDHEHILAPHSHVPGKNIRRDAEAGNVADMTRTVGIGPSNCREDMRHEYKITLLPPPVHLSTHSWTRFANESLGANLHNPLGGNRRRQ